MGVSTVALLGQARPPLGGASGCQEPPQDGIAQDSRTPWGRGYPGSAWCCSRLQGLPGLMQPSVNPTATRWGGPAHAGSVSVEFQGPGRPEGLVNGVGSPEWNGLNSCFSSAVDML